MPVDRLPEGWRGPARAALRLPLDLLGGTADVAELLANGGLAAGGYLGHKAGLLRPDQLPALLEGSPGTSEWMARKLGLEDKGEKGYNETRLAANLLPAASAAGRLAKGLADAALSPVPRQNQQRGAILADESWLNQPGGPRDARPDGSPLGRLSMAGSPRLAALARQPGVPSLLEQPMARASDVPLRDLSPEVRGTPLESLSVDLMPVGSQSGAAASYSPAQKRIWLNTGRGASGQELLGSLHHEATHGAQDLLSLAGQGSSTDRVRQGLANPQQMLSSLDRVRNPEVARGAERLWGAAEKSPYAAYRGNLGEVQAEVGNHSSRFVAPNSSTLQNLARQESSGLNVQIPFIPTGADAPLPFPTQLLEQGYRLERRGPMQTLHVLDPAGEVVGTVPNTGIIPK